MAAEAAGLGRTRLTVAFLLHAMVAAPDGLVERACRFRGYDPATLRSRTPSLLGERVDRPPSAPRPAARRGRCCAASASSTTGPPASHRRCASSPMDWPCSTT